jgi:hypothetical protein
MLNLTWWPPLLPFQQLVRACRFQVLDWIHVPVH